ncbi:MAG: hypothetical protein R2860_16755 [Desulfobacterales bacterium]
MRRSGATTEFAPELVVPDPALSIRDGAVRPWENRNSVQFAEFRVALDRSLRRGYLYTI